MREPVRDVAARIAHQRVELAPRGNGPGRTPTCDPATMKPLVHAPRGRRNGLPHPPKNATLGESRTIHPAGQQDRDSGRRLPPSPARPPAPRPRPAASRAPQGRPTAAGGGPSRSRPGRPCGARGARGPGREQAPDEGRSGRTPPRRPCLSTPPWSSNTSEVTQGSRSCAFARRRDLLPRRSNSSTRSGSLSAPPQRRQLATAHPRTAPIQAHRGPSIGSWAVTAATGVHPPLRTYTRPPADGPLQPLQP